jgi:hypothetical protein
MAQAEECKCENVRRAGIVQTHNALRFQQGGAALYRWCLPYRSGMQGSRYRRKVSESQGICTAYKLQDITATDTLAHEPIWMRPLGGLPLDQRPLDPFDVHGRSLSQPHLA